MKIDQMKPAEFIERVTDPVRWLGSARDLLWSAGKVRIALDSYIQASSKITPFGEIASYYMLMNYAFENLFKALVVVREKKNIEDAMKKKCRIPAKILNHSLLEFAEKYDFLKDEVGDESMLKKMERCAVWYGRYPTSTSPTGMDSFYESDCVDFPVSMTSYSSSDFNDIDSMLDRLLQLLRNECSNKSVDTMCDRCAATHASR